MVPIGDLLCFSGRLSGTSVGGGWSRAGGVFQGLDRAEKAAQASFVVPGIRRIGQPLVDRCADGLLFRLAGLGQGQLRPDVELKGVQEGVVAGRGAHLSSRRDVGECLWRALATWE